jgi:hypothetical protein
LGQANCTQPFSDTHKSEDDDDELGDVRDIALQQGIHAIADGGGHLVYNSVGVEGFKRTVSKLRSS